MKKKDSYQELLKDPRWIKRRNEILARDKNTCQFCGAQDRYMHVHHKKYFDGHLPWEYDDEVLVTLCDDCHKYIHDCDDLKLSDAEVGQVYSYEHSDFENTAIVYFVDGIIGVVYTIECDNGTNFDNIYLFESSYTHFRKKYHRVSCSRGHVIYLFESWFLYISDHLGLTPVEFRFNYDLILQKNPYLRHILENRNEYEYKY